MLASASSKAAAPRQSHLTVIENSASFYAHAHVFKIPKVSRTGVLEAWLPITYSQFRDDIQRFARYWAGILQSTGVQRKSVIALWLQGMTYPDVLHVLAISRAGYVPLLLYTANAFLDRDVLRQANAQALIYDGAYATHLPTLPIPVLPTVNAHYVEVPNATLPRVTGDAADKTAFIFHTAGITQGTPKVVRCTYAQLDILLWKAQVMCTPKRPRRQDVYSWRSTIGHVSSLFLLFGAIAHGSCVIQPTRADFTSAELADMIARGGLNRLHRPTSHLASLIRESRQDRHLTQLLSGLDEIVQTGRMLEREDEEWAIQNGLPVSTVFGTTEIPVILISDASTGSASLLRPLEGIGCIFVPLIKNPSVGDVASGATAYQNINSRVVELVVPPESPYCPDRTLRNSDGYFHTGDLFLEVGPGLYAFRGRISEWIRSDGGQIFDAKLIEDNVKLTCNDIVAECVVVGNGRPSPILLVEPAAAAAGGAIGNTERFKKEIIRRTRHFHSKRLLHERISSTHFVLVVGGGGANVWPRTPMGNIRRQDVEEAFRAELDRIYATRMP